MRVLTRECIYDVHPVTQAGVKHIVLAVNYRAEVMERELRQYEAEVSRLDFVVECV